MRARILSLTGSGPSLSWRQTAHETAETFSGQACQSPESADGAEAGEADEFAETGDGAEYGDGAETGLGAEYDDGADWAETGELATAGEAADCAETADITSTAEYAENVTWRTAPMAPGAARFASTFTNGAAITDFSFMAWAGA